MQGTINCYYLASQLQYIYAEATSPLYFNLNSANNQSDSQGARKIAF